MFTDIAAYVKGVEDDWGDNGGRMDGWEDGDDVIVGADGDKAGDVGNVEWTGDCILSLLAVGALATYNFLG